MTSGVHANDRVAALLLIGAGLLGIIITGFVAASGSPRLGVALAWGTVALSSAALVRLAMTGRLLSVDAVAAIAALLHLGLRPAYLYRNEADLSAFRGAETFADALNKLWAQEVANFVTTRFNGSAQQFLERPMELGGLFIATFLVGRAGAQWFRARRLGLTSGYQPSHRSLAVAVVVLSLIGLAGQATIILRAGGIGAALGGQNNQVLLVQPFVLQTMASCVLVAATLVAARGVGSKLWWPVLGILVTEALLYSLLSGSRARTLAVAFMVVAVIHLVRVRIRPIVVIAALAAFIGLSTVMLTMRSAQNASGVAGTPIALGTVLQDNALFDSYAIMTHLVPNQRSYQDGDRLLAGVSAIIPGDEGLAPVETGDVAFRRMVWGDEYGAGRPFSVVGEAYWDFGTWGVGILGAVWGLMSGIWREKLHAGSCNWLLGITAPLLLLATWSTITGTYESFAGVVVVIGAPLAVAILGMLMLDGRRRRRYGVVV